MRLLERTQVAGNALWMALHVVEDTAQRLQYFLSVFEAAIVGSLHPRMMPEGFRRVESEVPVSFCP